MLLQEMCVPIHGFWHLKLFVISCILSGGWGTRHTFAILAFLGFANVYAMRVNLSVAIVAMVNTSKKDCGINCLLHN